MWHPGTLGKIAPKSTVSNCGKSFVGFSRWNNQKRQPDSAHPRCSIPRFWSVRTWVSHDICCWPLSGKHVSWGTPHHAPGPDRNSTQGAGSCRVAWQFLFGIKNCLGLKIWQNEWKGDRHIALIRVDGLVLWVQKIIWIIAIWRLQNSTLPNPNLWASALKKNL